VLDIGAGRGRLAKEVFFGQVYFFVTGDVFISPGNKAGMAPTAAAELFT